MVGFLLSVIWLAQAVSPLPVPPSLNPPTLNLPNSSGTPSYAPGPSYTQQVMPVQPGSANWPYVILGICTLLFGANGAIVAWHKFKADQIKSLTDKIDGMYAKMSDQAGQVGRLEGQVSLLNSQLEVMRKENLVNRGLANKWRTVAKSNRLKLGRLKQELATLKAQEPKGFSQQESAKAE